MYIITIAHTLLDSEMWSKTFLFSSYLRLHANSTSSLYNIVYCDIHDA